MLRLFGVFLTLGVFLGILTITNFAQKQDAGVKGGSRTNKKDDKRGSQNPKTGSSKSNVPPPPPRHKKNSPSSPKSGSKSNAGGTKKTNRADTRTELSVIVDQSEVRIFIDGNEYPVQSESSPFVFDFLEPATYEVRVEKEGFRPETRTVKLTAGKKGTVIVNLKAVLGFLDISTNQPDSVIEVNNLTFSGSVNNLPLTAGSYSISISKKGFKSISYSVRVENGRKTSEVVILERLTVRDMLDEATSFFENKDYSRTLAVCRQILSLEPNNSDAFLLAGYSYFYSNRAGESFAYFSPAMRQGRKVTLPVQFAKKEQGFQSMTSGFIEMGGIGIEFWSESNPGQRFQTSSTELQELKTEKTHFSLKANFLTGQKPKRETYLFGHSVAMPRQTQETIFRLLQQMKNGYSGSGNDFGVVYLPSDRFQTVRKNNFQLNAPENWREVLGDGDSALLAPAGGFKEIKKQINYSHGLQAGLVRLTNNALSLEKLAENTVNALLKANTQHRRKTEFSYFTLNGKPALTITLEGYSLQSQRQETVNAYYALNQYGDFFYLYTVAPVDEEDDYRETFQKILNSVRF